MVTNAILQANGKPSRPILATVAGGIANLTVCWLLVGLPQVHIYGAALGTVAYCLVALIVNLSCIRCSVPDAPRFLPQISKTIPAAVLMGVTAFVLYSGISNVVLTVAVSCGVYAVGIVALRVLTWYDCTLLPKGQLIAKLLGIKPDETTGT